MNAQDKNFVTFANAMEEVSEMLKPGESHKAVKTSYTCPVCGNGKLFAQLLVIDGRHETEVDCTSCKTKQSFHI